MKYIISILFFFTLASIVSGFLWESEISEQLIGFGVLGLFVIVFPLFSYHRWKDKNVKDYMITKENLDKMRDFKDKN
jgi:pilus assembly protein TadC